MLTNSQAGTASHLCLCPSTLHLLLVTVEVLRCSDRVQQLAAVILMDQSERAKRAEMSRLPVSCNEATAAAHNAPEAVSACSTVVFNSDRRYSRKIHIATVDDDAAMLVAADVPGCTREEVTGPLGITSTVFSYSHLAKDHKGTVPLPSVPEVIHFVRKAGYKLATSSQIGPENSTTHVFVK